MHGFFEEIKLVPCLDSFGSRVWVQLRKSKVIFKQRLKESATTRFTEMPPKSTFRVLLNAHIIEKLITKEKEFRLIFILNDEHVLHQILHKNPLGIYNLMKLIKSTWGI